MTKLSVYGGLFSDPPLLSTDADPKRTDPYNKMDTIPSRYLGKGMTIGRGETGHHPNVFFDKKYLTLASPEQAGKTGHDLFVDAETQRRREAKESKKKNVSDKIFLPPSFPKTSDGSGSYSGCFQTRAYEFFVPTEDSPKKGRRRKKAASALEITDKTKTGLPNVKTNPPKKGTYGFPGTLLDNPKYNENWMQEHEQLEAAWAKAEKKKQSAPKAMGPPFKIPGVTHDYLDELVATGVSGVYKYVPVEEKPSKKKHSKRVIEPPVFEQEKPMFFAAAKSGAEGCISRFPNTWLNPDELEEARNKGKKKRKSKKLKSEYVPGPPKGASGLWKPNSFYETSVIQSCLRRFH